MTWPEWELSNLQLHSDLADLWETVHNSTIAHVGWGVGTSKAVWQSRYCFVKTPFLKVSLSVFVMFTTQLAREKEAT